MAHKILVATLLSLMILNVGAQESSTQEVQELNNRIGTLYRQGHYADAIPLAERALAINEKVLGPEHPNTANSLNNLAALYQTTGAYDKAEPLYQRALAIREKVLGPEQIGRAHV